MLSSARWVSWKVGTRTISSRATSTDGAPSRLNERLTR